MIRTAPFPERRQQLRRSLASRNLEGLLVTDEVNVRYLTGFTGDSSAVLITPDQAIILSDRRYEVQLQQECADMEMRIRGPESRLPDLIGKTVASLGCGSLALEDHAVSWALLETLRKCCKPVELVPTSGLVGQLRAIKDAGEIETIRRAVTCAEKAYRLLIASLREGLTEIWAARTLETAIREFGGEGVGFSSIIASGPASALPHYHPHAAPIVDGSPLLIDWGAKVDGYTSDMTRTLQIGGVDSFFSSIYDVVLRAQLAAINEIRPGARLRDIDAAARDVIGTAGYGDNFGHGLGHGIGLQVHESPRLAVIEEGVLAPGMVITIEPGIYFPGKFGIRIEDDVLVTENGHEVLGTLPKGLEENVVFL